MPNRGNLIRNMNHWDQVKEILSGRLAVQSYDSWLSRTHFKSADGRVLSVSVPDEVTKEWMQQEYAGEVWTAIRELDLPSGRLCTRSLLRCSRIQRALPASPR